MSNWRLTILGVAAILVALPAVAQYPTQPGNTSGHNQDLLQVGGLAPDFKLKTKDGKQQIQLSAFRGKRPIVLIFGSYT